MDLNAFQQKTTGAVGSGEIVFFEGNWQLAVKFANGIMHLINISGKFNSPLTQIHVGSTDRCVGISENFRWFLEGEVALGVQPAPRHLSITISDSGPVIAAVVQGQYMFFSTAGEVAGVPMRDTLCFVKWSLHLRDIQSDGSWQLVQVNSQPANG